MNLQMKGKPFLILALTAAVRIVGWPDSASHAIAVRVLDPAMSELSNKLEGTFTMEPHANHPPGWESAVHLSMVVQFEAVEAGTYGFDLSVDGLSHTMPFRIELVASSPD